MTKRSANTTPHEETPGPASVVGIGASAGGVESLSEFFAALPTDLDAAYVVVIHLSPDVETTLDDILARQTSLHVEVLEGTHPLRAGRVYVRPPRGTISLTPTTITHVPLSEAVDAREGMHPVDQLFVTLSESHRERALGVVLSGSGSDGAMGVRAIKASGGLVLVENPDSARFDGMPRTSHSSVVPDAVASPAGLAQAVGRILTYGIESESSPREVADDPTERALALLKERNGYDFRSYRRSTVRRRILRRAALAGIEKLSTYVELLGEKTDERDALCRDLLINVTDFFRDRAAFEALDRLVIRPLVAQATSHQPLRVWVPACATGEEAYTIALLLAHAFEREGNGGTFQLFASDLDAKAIETAGQGFFGVGIEQRVPQPLLERYFHRSADHYRVRSSLRERMVFAVHDLTQDPPFTRTDLVSCRNLLVYIRAELQEHLLRLMAYALKPGGHLFLGSSESMNAASEAFAAIDSEHRIYCRNETAVTTPRLQSLDALLYSEVEPVPRTTTPFVPSAVTGNATQGAMVEHLVRRTAVFGLALDAQMRLQHVYGDPGNALHVPSGGVTTEISALTRGEFKTALLTAVSRAHRQQAEVVAHAVAVENRSGAQRMDVEVLPLDPPAGRISTLVLVKRESKGQSAGIVHGAPDATAIGRSAEAARSEVLEHELQVTRDQLTNAIEELEVSNEELQTTNEELQSTNEELQNTNEELRSTNDELYTVNCDHRERIVELTEVTTDLENVLVHSEVGTILLDRDLHIRKFTKVAAQVVHLIDQDRDRPLHHITHALEDVDLSVVAREVLEEAAGQERTVHSVDGRTYLMRCRPLGEGDEIVEGVMFSFTDITKLERITRELRMSERRFRHVMDHVDQAVFLRRRSDQGIEFVSRYGDALFGDQATIESIEKILDHVHADDFDTVRDALSGSPEVEVEVDFRLADPGDADERWIHCNIRPTNDVDGLDGYDVGYLFDITARKQSELELRREVDRFEGFVTAIPDQFFWRGLDGRWWRLRSLMPGHRLDDERYPPLQEIVSKSALRAIDTAADVARDEGSLQTISFDAHDERKSRSFEARLLMVTDQGVICALRDVSDLRRSERELVKLTRSLEREANSDHLTRLPNRRGLEKVLFSEIERARRLGSRLCAILVDCDNFKRVNDTMGHATGDIVLQEIGKRLRGVMRPSDTIGRVGGDEFLVLLPDTRHAEAMQLAERLRMAITGSPLTSGRDVIGITGSLGVANVPQDVVSIEEVISLTQHALAHSKRVGKNRVTSHEHEGLVATDPRDELISILETGRGFRTFAQPILDLQTGQIDGYELLTRGPGGALESPADIFQLSSENNILTSVDLHCVKRSVGWARDHLDRGRFHVNLFPSTILDTPAARLLAVFGDPGLLRHFCVEISEQQFIGDPMYLRPHVEELRREGARIALDDVGFGRSSLESLLLLEPETVKLDKSVVHGAYEDAAQRRTLERLVGVIRGIDADIVAEGIETETDLEVLKDLGVEFGQGFLFGRPSDTLSAEG